MTEERKELTAEEARAAVTQILAAAGVTYMATYVGERKRDGWDCDAWVITMARKDGHTSETFEYFTGRGLRKVAKIDAIHAKHRGIQAAGKPVEPHPADVLHCVLLDSSAVGQSFESWCSDFGYDSDSRKAEANYRACQNNADKIARLLGAQQRKALAEALQDY